MVNIKHEFERLWTESKVLTSTGILMLGALCVFTAGIVLDPRTVTGAPAWLKPAKFAVSTAIFSLTVAWLYRYLSVWRPFLRALAGVISGVFVLEVAIIAFQAARGVPSHFNASSQFDGALFSVMGVAIGILWLATVGLFAALLRQRFEDRAWGWWLRLGVLITVIGSAAGGSMLRLTEEQAAARRAGQRLAAIGGHTVGAEDGGPGLPGTGWSTEHGDLRVAHFFGLHGMQILPLTGWLLSRRRHRFAGQTRLAFITAASYTGLFAIVYWQALRGQSVVAPDEGTVTALAGWGILTVAALFGARGEFVVQNATAARHGAR